MTSEQPLTFSAADPTSFHLSEVATPKSSPAAQGVDASKIRKEKGQLNDYFLDQERPYL